MIFIAKEDSWFKSGTEVKIVDNSIVEDAYSKCALFEGIRISEGEGIHPSGVEYLDKEMCPFEEFDIIE